MIDITGLREDKRPQSSTIVHALLDRLEAAESECLEQARLNGMGAEREAALLAKLEAAEKERDFAKTEIARLHDDIRELTDVRVLDEEDRDRIVAWLQGTSTKPAPSVPDDVMRDAKRYRFLRAAKNIPISTEAARDPIVYDAAIDAAMLAAAPEAKT